MQLTFMELEGFFKPKLKTRAKSTTTSVSEAIFSVLTKSKLRLGHLESDIELILRKKVNDSVQNDKPITLILGTGGFKNYRIDTAPHIDWAEVFQLSFMIESLFEIAEIYKPGVHLEYSGDAEAMLIVNNLEAKQIWTYNHEFGQLVELANESTPDNFKITQRDFSSFYTRSEIAIEVEKRLRSVDWNSEQNKKLIVNKYSSATNNFCFCGEEDLTNLNSDGAKQKIKESILKHKLWLEIDYEKRGEYLEGGINIPVVHRKGVPGAYALKSCKGCDIQFWIGKGVFLDKSLKRSWILSANKYYTAKSGIDFLVNEAEYTDVFPGLSFIPVYCTPNSSVLI